MTKLLKSWASNPFLPISFSRSDVYHPARLLQVLLVALVWLVAWVRYHRYRSQQEYFESLAVLLTIRDGRRVFKMGGGEDGSYPLFSRDEVADFLMNTQYTMLGIVCVLALLFAVLGRRKKLDPRSAELRTIPASTRQVITGIHEFPFLLSLPLIVLALASFLVPVESLHPRMEGFAIIHGVGPNILASIYLLAVVPGLFYLLRTWWCIRFVGLRWGLLHGAKQLAVPFAIGFLSMVAMTPAIFDKDFPPLTYTALALWIATAFALWHAAEALLTRLCVELDGEG